MHRDELPRLIRTIPPIRSTTHHDGKADRVIAALLATATCRPDSRNHRCARKATGTTDAPTREQGFVWMKQTDSERYLAQ